ncbi:MAG: hypothetical protein E7399_03185 [Ruminococcaceae bacterium]|nr:hypothetical protein [Oscillospiraceae bacterium]
MHKKICSLLLGLTMAVSAPFCTFANQPVDEVICTTTKGGNFDQMEQTILQGISRDGSVVWTYDTGMKETGSDTNVYWHGQSGNLFFLNYKGSLQAFDAETGTIIWSTPEGEYSFAEGIFDNSGNLCMVNKKGPIILLDRNGNVLAKFNTDQLYSSLILSSMTLNDNKLVIKYAAKGHGAETQAFNDYATMPSLSVDLSNYQSKIKITIDGNPVAFDVAPFIQQDRTFVPVRAIFEGLGAQVNWDGETKTVTAQKGDTTVSLVIGTKEITVNDTVKTLDVSPQIVQNRTMVPARAVSEAFGYEVGWDGGSQTVSVTTKAQQTTETYSLNTTPFSYLNQTYGTLRSALGDIAQTEWFQGPIVKLGSSEIWMGFGDGSWYTQEPKTIADDAVCNCIMATASLFIPQITQPVDIAAIETAFGISVPEPQTDAEGNTFLFFSHLNKYVSIYLNEANQITSDSLIMISNVN